MECLVAQYPVRRGQTVYVNDTDLQLVSTKNTSPVEKYDDEAFPVGRARDVPLRFFLDSEPAFRVQPGEVNIEFTTIAFSASFGGDPLKQTRFVSGAGKGVGSRLVRVPSNKLGCEPYASSLTNTVVLAHRGTCTFLEKLVHATRAGARGVIVASDNDLPLNPSAEIVELEEFAGDSLGDVVLVAITHSAGEEISRMLDTAEARGVADVIVSVEPEGQSGKADTQPPSEPAKEGAKQPNTRVLYLNGHPLLNTRLLI